MYTNPYMPLPFLLQVQLCEVALSSAVHLQEDCDAEEKYEKILHMAAAAASRQQQQQQSASSIEMEQSNEDTI